MENFEEWFAIRVNHADESHWPGRLTFNLEHGIHLDCIRFSEHSNNPVDKTFNSSTITGWLDYQRPATLIRPWIQSVAGHSISVNSPAMRTAYRIVADAVLKNVFLDEIDTPIFTGLIVEHPAVHAWVDPQLVKRSWKSSASKGNATPSVDIGYPIERQFKLNNGIEATVTSSSRFSNNNTTSVNEYTSLNLRFSTPLNYSAISRMIWKISTIFNFLVGYRTDAPNYQIPTTETRPWNNEATEIVAELWYIPANRRKTTKTSKSESLTTENSIGVSINSILNMLTEENDDIFYFSQIIQSIEDRETTITHGFGELLGCLENFDNLQFGSGADPDFTENVRKLQLLITSHGTKSDLALFQRMRGATRNNYSLLKRLERLHKFWADDGFRGSPNLSRIRDIRNLTPHGRGLQISSDVAKEIIDYQWYLAALGRYHIFKILGVETEAIANAYCRHPHRFGPFVPEKLLPDTH